MRKARKEARPLGASIRDQLRAVRLARRLTLYQVAEGMERYGARLSVSTLANYEAGHSSIRFEDALVMALVLRVRLDQLALPDDDAGDISFGSAGVAPAERVRQLFMEGYGPEHEVELPTDVITYISKTLQAPAEALGLRTARTPKKKATQLERRTETDVKAKKKQEDK